MISVVLLLTMSSVPSKPFGVGTFPTVAACEKAMEVFPFPEDAYGTFTLTCSQGTDVKALRARIYPPPR